MSEVRQVDKYQTVAWEKNRYSVPRRQAFATVTVKAYVDRVEASESNVDVEGYISAWFNKYKRQDRRQRAGRIRWYYRMPTSYVLQGRIEDSTVGSRRHVIVCNPVTQILVGG